MKKNGIDPQSRDKIEKRHHVRFDDENTKGPVRPTGTALDLDLPHQCPLKMADNILTKMDSQMRNRR